MTSPEAGRDEVGEGAVEGAGQLHPKSRLTMVLSSDITQPKLPMIQMHKLRPRKGKKLAQGPTESLKQGVKSRLLVPISVLHPWLKKFKKV